MSGVILKSPLQLSLPKLIATLKTFIANLNLLDVNGIRRFSTATPPPYSKILIANRGEIACRIIKTCKKMGIKTVAIFSTADSQALHVRMADEAVHIGPPPSKDSYLNIESIMTAIHSTGAQAVHPGYGFLSENFSFSEILTKNGIVFIGPGPEALRSMGDKIESKKIAINAKVNTIPGFDGVIESEGHALEISSQIGYPVMIKASAGGGGKGMRIAFDSAQLREGYHLAKSEAASSFGDDRLLVEKFVENPRHIEIQVLADQHGNTLYLNERECSIQRRNQKVIEEAPSTFIDEHTRQAMGVQAVFLARAVNYVSAGTVEFLVDKQKQFYFLEMNTRLQVEHPVTEYITGLDLVQEMINISAGRKLPYSQQDIGINGWAIESRVYAEDPIHFLPSIGRLSTYIEPPPSQARTDSGVVEGSEISMYYDAMISKLITHGPDRKSAIDNMKTAMGQYFIKGVKHNLPLLYDVLSHPRFVNGDINTHFLNEVYPDGFVPNKLSRNEEELLAISAAILYVKGDSRRRNIYSQNSNVTRETQHSWELVVKLTKETHINISVTSNDNKHYTVLLNNNNSLTVISNWKGAEPFIKLKLNEEDITLQYLGRHGQTYDVGYKCSIYKLSVETVAQNELGVYMKEKLTESSPYYLNSPMPGVVKTIYYKEQENVAYGSSLIVIEAMKMQNVLVSPMTGRIKKINVSVGTGVAEGDCLVEFYQDTPENSDSNK